MNYILIIIVTFICIMPLETLAQIDSEYRLSKRLVELEYCSSAITDLVNNQGDVPVQVINIQDILGTLSTLDTLAEEDLSYYRGLLENLTSASTTDRHNTLQEINDTYNDPLRDVRGQGDMSPCSSHRPINDNEFTNYTRWREPDIRRRRRYRTDSWAEGVYRYSKFNACPNHIRCALIHMAVLPDSSIAVADAENYEIRVYSLRGAFLRKFNVLPLEPNYMAHWKEFIVFVRMKNLNGNYIIAEVDLWKMTMRTVIEFYENFPWEFACTSPFTVVNDVLFIGCTPYLFMYDVNGTQLNNFTASDQQRIFVFHTEEGSERIFVDAPAFPGSFTNRPTVIDTSSPDVPFCSLQNVTWAITGAMGASYTFYAVEERSRYRVQRYGPNCEPEGSVVEINRRHQFVTLSVFGDLLVGQVNGKWRRRYNNMIHVFKLIT